MDTHTIPIDLNKEDIRTPLPGFTVETARIKVRKAEDAWNSKNPTSVASAYSLTSEWRNRDSFIQGRQQIVQFLTAKWQREQHYKLIKELWAVNENRIAVRFVYEWQNKLGQWFRSHGNENWQFNDKGLMEQRHASINDIAIDKRDRKLTWEGEKRPTNYPELSDLNL